MAVQKKGAATTATWGVPTAVYNGRVVKVTKATSGEEVPLDNSDGETDGMALFNEKDEYDIEVIYDAAFTPPAYAASFTVNSAAGVVLNVTVNWENKGWRKATVRATDFSQMTL
jgi:hypothetical protein